jgi:hypothetical protein
VNDQETEKSAIFSNVGASSQMGAKRKKKNQIKQIACPYTRPSRRYGISYRLRAEDGMCKFASIVVSPV